MHDILINSEQGAAQYLERLNSDLLTAYDGVQFDNSWLNFNLKIYDGEKHSVISTEVMLAFVEYEKRLRHMYALLKYGDPLRRLNDQEKEKLSIELSVHDGCTENTIKNIKDLAKHLTDLMQVATENMSPNQKFALILTALLILGGYFVSDAIIEINQADEITTQKEIEASVIKSTVSKALEKNDPSGQIIRDSKVFENQLNSSISNVDQANISGRRIVASTQANKSKKREAHHKQLNGEYLVKSFDFAKENPRIKVEYKNNGMLFFANLDDFINDTENQALLLKSAINHKPITLKVNATFRNNELHEAFVTGILTE